MPYFKACVKEASRFAPSTPFLLPRYVDQNGMNLKGRWAAPGVEVAANPYVIHRDREVFGMDADEFRPERWLEDEERTRIMEKYILSWGYGTRTCLGKNIAQLQVQKMVIQVSYTLMG
jgi:cytochrome P450